MLCRAAVSLATRVSSNSTPTAARACSSLIHKPRETQHNKLTEVHQPEKELVFEEVTHTGQAWDSSDYRLARFIENDKQVNPNVAMHLIAQQKPTACKKKVVSCDGGGGALGHPKIYINLVRRLILTTFFSCSIFDTFYILRQVLPKNRSE